MSILNPNVFFEFGIRAALDKPVALVVDDKTSPIPFDAGIINFHQYDSSLFPWTLEKQKKELTKHVKNAYKKSEGKNALWKYFGVSQTGTFKPEEAELGDKIDVIMKQLSALERQQILQKDMIVSNVSKYNNDTIPVKPEVFLTLIEKKILEMVLDGKSNSEIADLINRSKRTVEAHRSHIMQKLNLSPKTNLKELYIRAVRLGLVEF